MEKCGHCENEHLYICKDCNTKFCEDCFTSKRKKYHDSSHNVFINVKTKKHKLERREIPTEDEPNLQTLQFDNNDTETTNTIFKPSTICPLKQSISEDQNQSIADFNNTLFDGNRIIKFKDENDFIANLNIFDSNSKVQVVSIISDSQFDVAKKCFHGFTQQLPEKSSRSKSPTCLFVYNDEKNFLILDTENLYKSIENQTTHQDHLKQLLCILSDVLIFTTPDDKSHKSFIAIRDFMNCFKENYLYQLKSLNRSKPESLLPAILCVKYREPLTKCDLPTLVKNRGGNSDLFYNFTDMTVVKDDNLQDFEDKLTNLLRKIKSTRAERSLREIFDFIQECSNLSDSSKSMSVIYPIRPDWFRCQSKCELCNVVCCKSLQHSDDHDNTNYTCQPDSDKKNIIYICKQCRDEKCKMNHLSSKQMSSNQYLLTNIFAYPYRGSIVECPEHGIIYDHNILSNQSANEDKVVIQYIHKWPNQPLPCEKIYTIGRQTADCVNDTMKPFNDIMNTVGYAVTDRIQPSSWQSNFTLECSICNIRFVNSMSKHHCRYCGLVICVKCTVVKNENNCCQDCSNKNSPTVVNEEPMYYKATKAVSNVWLKTVGVIKKFTNEAIRPTYWEPDDEVNECPLCNSAFHDELNKIHHCRCCGKCVCDNCSRARKTVPWRNVDSPNRICDKCLQSKKFEQEFSETT